MNVDPKRILIVKLSSLGDIVQSLPVLSALKEQFPLAAVTWLVNDIYSDFLEQCSNVDKIIPFHRSRWGKISNIYKTIREFRTLISQIKGYDLVIDLQGLLRSGIITGFSGSAYRIGFRNAREGARVFYNHRIRPKSKHSMLRYLELAEYIGCKVDNPKFNMKVPESLKEWAHGILGNEGKHIAICVGSRWETKCWPVQKYTELIERLYKKHNAKIILIGDKNDIALGERIVKNTNIPAKNYIGKTSLPQLSALLCLCNMLITSDSGPMHLGNALGIPVVVLFGPTDPECTGPYGLNNKVIVNDIVCRPCFKKICPDSKCMEDISVDEVFSSAEDILSKG